MIGNAIDDVCSFNRAVDVSLFPIPQDSCFSKEVETHLVDKFSSRKLIPFMNVPLLIGMLILYFFDFSYSAYFFFGLVGISNGLANVLGSSTWAEIYGVRYLGSIKALTTALMVFSTAFGTAIFGLLIDKGFTIEHIALVSLI